MNLSKVYFVVNANRRIGIGHLSRCMLLAAEFRIKKVEVEFISYDLSQIGERIIEGNDFKLSLFSRKEEIINLKDRITEFGDKLIIFDSDNDYFYQENVQDDFIKLGVKIMFITVKNQFKFKSHFILNQNIIALNQKYITEEYTAKMLGPDYFIISDKFKNIDTERESRREESNNLLVTFGSADPNNLTEKVLDLLESHDSVFTKITVVIGGLNKHKNQILNHSFIQKERHLIDVVIDAKNMAVLMADSDVAITSLGLTFWELSIYKVPCILISGSQREKDQISFFYSRKFAHYMGNFDDLDWEEKWSRNLKRFNVDELLYQELSDKINVSGKTKIVNEILSNF